MPEPVLGVCTFDVGSGASVFDVVFTFDNSASTLPVVFGVQGRDDLTRTVGAGEKVSVTAPGLVQGLAPHDVAILTDGRSSGSFSPRVRAVMCRSGRRSSRWRRRTWAARFVWWGRW
ncbi:hypothetical protein NKG05_16640 [Oerskovia sp. M15]